MGCCYCMFDPSLSEKAKKFWVMRTSDFRHPTREQKKNQIPRMLRRQLNMPVVWRSPFAIARNCTLLRGPIIQSGAVVNWVAEGGRMRGKRGISLVAAGSTTALDPEPNGRLRPSRLWAYSTTHHELFHRLTTPFSLSSGLLLRRDGLIGTPVYTFYTVRRSSCMLRTSRMDTTAAGTCASSSVGANREHIGQRLGNTHWWGPCGPDAWTAGWRER